MLNVLDVPPSPLEKFPPLVVLRRLIARNRRVRVEAVLILKAHHLIICQDNQRQVPRSPFPEAVMLAIARQVTLVNERPHRCQADESTRSWPPCSPPRQLPTSPMISSTPMPSTARWTREST